MKWKIHEILNNSKIRKTIYTFRKLKYYISFNNLKLIYLALVKDY